MLDSILDFIYKINSFNLGIGIYIFYILFGKHIIDTYTKSNISKSKIDTNEEKTPILDKITYTKSKIAKLKLDTNDEMMSYISKIKFDSNEENMIFLDKLIGYTKSNISKKKLDANEENMAFLDRLIKYSNSNISKTKVDTNKEKKLDIKVNNQKIKFITDPNYNPYDDDSDEENNRLINEQNILLEMKYTQEMNEQNRIWDEYNRAKELNSYKNQSWYILGYPSERAYTNAVFSGTYLKNNNRKR